MTYTYFTYIVVIYIIYTVLTQRRQYTGETFCINVSYYNYCSYCNNGGKEKINFR